MNKQAMLKTRTCVLRLNIHCEGCEHKVRKKLKKIKGVDKVHVDAEQGKVTVSGNVDPKTLIDKLEKDGKHAQLWGPPQKGGPVFPNQFMKNPQIEKPNGGKGKSALKGGGFQQKKGPPKDVKIVDKRSVKVVENFSDDDDYLDDSEYDDDEFDEGFDAPHQPHNKAAPFAGHGGNLKGNKGGNDGGKEGKSSPNEHSKGKKGGSDAGKKDGGGGGIDMFIKGLLGRSGSKKEGGKKGDKKKNGGFVVAGEGRNGAVKANGKKSEKSEEKSFDGGLKMGNKQHEMKNFVMENHRGGGGDGWSKGGLGGQKGNYAADLGQFQGGGGQQGNHPPHQNQQEMERMMMMMAMMNQRGRNGNGHEAYGGGPMMNAPPPQYGGPMMMNAPSQYGGPMMTAPLQYGGPMMYAPPQHPAVRYGPPPPGNDEFTHMFNDENTDSCSIM